MTETKTLTSLQSAGLEHVFDFDLAASSAREPFVSSKGRDGEFIVNGSGIVRGEKVRGKISLSFFAKDCAYLLVQAGIEPTPGQHLCKESDGGVIETEDGARIIVDTRGYGLRGYDPTHPKRWRLAMTVQFSTDDTRYKWLNRAFGFWEGQFDEEIGSASYRGYIQRFD